MLCRSVYPLENVSEIQCQRHGCVLFITLLSLAYLIQTPEQICYDAKDACPLPSFPVPPPDVASGPALLACTSSIPFTPLSQTAGM